jgi:hypothetical protein
VKSPLRGSHFEEPILKDLENLDEALKQVREKFIAGDLQLLITRRGDRLEVLTLPEGSRVYLPKGPSFREVILSELHRQRQDTAQLLKNRRPSTEDLHYFDHLDR